MARREGAGQLISAEAIPFPKRAFKKKKGGRGEHKGLRERSAIQAV